MYPTEEYGFDTFKNQGTGSHGNFEDYKIIVYPVGKYEVKIKLTPANEFLGVTEVKINKGFLSYKQKIASQGFHDVDEFYRE